MLARLDAARVRLDAAPERVIEEGAPIVLDALRAEAPHRSGRLAAELEAHVEGKRATFSGGAPYTPYVVRGTMPHEIRHDRKKALWWLGALHPTPYVHHPGSLPNNFPKRALATARPFVRAMAKRIAHEVIAPV